MAFDTENFGVTEQPVSAGIGDNSDVVNVADLITSEANDASKQTDAPQTDAPDVQTEERKYTSDDMSKAVQNRLRQERKKAAYILGDELLKERMLADNVNEEEALKRIRDDRIKQKAAAFKANPEKAYEEMLRMRNQPIEPVEDARTTETDVERLYNSIVGDMQAGKVPQDFDLNAHMSDPNKAREFIDLYEAFGMEKACAYAMRMSAPTKAEINRSLPKPINTNNAYTPATPDIWAMSSEDFAKMDQKMKQARAQGKRVNF